MITADITEIQNRIIHRYENVLLDSVTYDPDNKDNNELSLTLSQDDELNRGIFLKQKKRGEYVLVTSVFMEILALSCIITENIIYFPYLHFVSNQNPFDPTRNPSRI